MAHPPPLTRPLSSSVSVSQANAGSGSTVGGHARFKKLGKIGEGSFGDVFKALDTETNELVAIKIINLEEASEDIDEIRSEITMLSECKSPYVTKYVTSFTHGSELCIVMEFLGGGSVHDLLDKGGLDENLVAVITRELLKAIDYLHSAGKIHRDIKAANILLSSKGEVKISDFGVTAKLTNTIQKRNTFCGTPFWMAPEVIQQADYNEKADVWSIGITVLEMFLGQPPFHDMHPMKALFAIPKADPPHLEANGQASRALKDFIRECLQKDHSKRPSCKALLSSKWIRGAKKNSLLSDVVMERALAKEMAAANAGGTSSTKKSANNKAGGTPSVSNGGALGSNEDAEGGEEMGEEMVGGDGDDDGGGDGGGNWSFTVKQPSVTAAKAKEKERAEAGAPAPSPAPLHPPTPASSLAPTASPSSNLPPPRPARPAGHFSSAKNSPTSTLASPSTTSTTNGPQTPATPSVLNAPAFETPAKSPASAALPVMTPSAVSTPSAALLSPLSTSDTPASTSARRTSVIAGGAGLASEAFSTNSAPAPVVPPSPGSHYVINPLAAFGSVSQKGGGGGADALTNTIRGGNVSEDSDSDEEDAQNCGTVRHASKPPSISCNEEGTEPVKLNEMFAAQQQQQQQQQKNASQATAAPTPILPSVAPISIVVGPSSSPPTPSPKASAPSTAANVAAASTEPSSSSQASSPIASAFSSALSRSVTQVASDPQYLKLNSLASLLSSTQQALQALDAVQPGVGAEFLRTVLAQMPASGLGPKSLSVELAGSPVSSGASGSPSPSAQSNNNHGSSANNNTPQKSPSSAGTNAAAAASPAAASTTTPASATSGGVAARAAAFGGKSPASSIPAYKAGGGGAAGGFPRKTSVTGASNASAAAAASASVAAPASPAARTKPAAAAAAAPTSGGAAPVPNAKPAGFSNVKNLWQQKEMEQKEKAATPSKAAPTKS